MQCPRARLCRFGGRPRGSSWRRWPGVKSMTSGSSWSAAQAPYASAVGKRWGGSPKVPPALTTAAMLSRTWPQIPEAGSVAGCVGLPFEVVLGKGRWRSYSVCEARFVVEEGRHVRLCRALDLDPGSVTLVEVSGVAPVVRRPRATDRDGKLEDVGLTAGVRERVAVRAQGGVVGKRAGPERLGRRDRIGQEIDERVEAFPGEELDATFAFDDLPDGGVVGRDDCAAGMAASGFGAREFDDLHVLRAVGADRERRAIRDVLDVVAIRVDLQLVVARRGPTACRTYGEVFIPNTVRGPEPLPAPSNTYVSLISSVSFCG